MAREVANIAGLQGFFLPSREKTGQAVLEEVSGFKGNGPFGRQVQAHPDQEWRQQADVAKSVDAADFRIGVPAGKSAE